MGVDQAVRGRGRAFPTFPPPHRFVLPATSVFCVRHFAALPLGPQGAASRRPAVPGGAEGARRRSSRQPRAAHPPHRVPRGAYGTPYSHHADPVAAPPISAACRFEHPCLTLLHVSPPLRTHRTRTGWTSRRRSSSSGSTRRGGSRRTAWVQRTRPRRSDNDRCWKHLQRNREHQWHCP